MITRFEVDGFKTFQRFSVDLRPFVAVVGANATGKSNLFDALKFLSRLAETDIRQAMQDLRGEPEELFRQSQHGTVNTMRFAVEVLLPANGTDEFGSEFETPSQRVRYELTIELKDDQHEIFVAHERCHVISGPDDQLSFKPGSPISRSHRKKPFLETELDGAGNPKFFVIRQDGLAKGGKKSRRGSPRYLPAPEASRTALSTIASSEFRHLYALKRLLSRTQFLEINPLSARRRNDRFDDKRLRSDASNLSAALAEIKRKTGTESRPEGNLVDISADLASLIPQVSSIQVVDDPRTKEYAFDVKLRQGQRFSSRVISDGTIRLIALLAVINDPDREGILCFEEPENGVHEGRIPLLIDILRQSTVSARGSSEYFQVLVNTHSPAVMYSLKPEEVLYADLVFSQDIDDEFPDVRTRMRRIQPDKKLFDEEHHLYPAKIEEILRHSIESGA